MKKAGIILGVFLFILLPGIFAQAQHSFPLEFPEFIQGFTTELNEKGKEIGAVAASELNIIWQNGQMEDAEKEKFIAIVNKMATKRYATNGGLSYFSQAYTALKKEDSKLDIDMEDFFMVNLEAVEKLPNDRMVTYLKWLNSYARTGYPIQKSRFYWSASQSNPKLSFETIKSEKESYVGPALTFNETDLFYKSNQYKDSTLIKGTQGTLYPLSMAFTGKGGTVTWEKVGFPAEQIFVVFEDFDVNLNFGLVKVDTVTFYYTDLIDHPLKGFFEDRNIGYRNLKKANYPYFKSFEGGVVIENFLPNIRYVGGFSMKGMRRIGTSYDIIQEPEPAEESEEISGSFLIDEENKSDEWGESNWDSYAEENASFSSDDEHDIYDDEWGDWGSAEGGYDNSAWGMSYQVVEHIPATIEILRNNKSVLKLAGEAFVLDDENMVGKKLQATLYTSDTDSLYHPSMDVLYEGSDTTVTLKKPKRSIYAQIPFTSSYHEYFLYFETIRWQLNKDQLEFTAFIDKENKVSAIESFDYFTKGRFDKYKGVLKFNPIGAIYRYSLTHPGDPIFPSSIMEEYRLMNDLPSMERTMPLLEGDGFIRYDRKSKEITPLPKLYTWSKAARKKKDFDAIQIISQVDTGFHARLDLDNMEIELNGVEYFSMSDSVFVRVIPSKERVVVENNRNLRFGGVVAAGRLNFYASDSAQSFHFDYESYSVMCDSLDSIRFVMVRNLDPEIEPTPLQKALNNTVFEGVTGAIHIDHPYNKSGEKDYPYFPVFDSYSKSYLYWASPDVEGGVYSKEKMHFAVDPFVLDSLETFDPTNLQFDGEFYSSEILPVIKQQLQVMDDNTLGFKKMTPPGGYDIYGKNGNFKEELILDSKGLRGNGTLEYLGTIAKSDSFVFHFDSVMAEVNYFNMKKGYRKGVYFPEVDASSAKYKWFTKDSTLQISSTFESLSLFEGEGSFTGTLKISEEGMIGNGEIVLGQVKVEGDSIVFSEMDFKADEAIFTILDEVEPDKVHFVAENVKIDYDVKKHVSKFSSFSPQTDLAYFPMHQYQTNLIKGVYTKDTYDLLLNNVTGLDSSDYFVSTHPAMDSLKFMATSAYYDVVDREIEVSGVDQILVADAIVMPDSAFAIIQEGGYLKPLEDATIEADKESKFHRIYDATVRINGKEDYDGSGKYDYIEVNGKEQFIEFNDIEVNSNITTMASGEITEEDGFYLTERIFFKGNARLDASRKFLEFEGEVKIESENEAFKGVWFDFKRTVVNPDSVFIPIADDLTNDIGEPLTVGLNFYPEGRTFYSTFLQPKEDEDDLEILSASGGLTFDRKKKEFKIGTREKLQGEVYKGSTVAFNDEALTITSAGFLKFPYDFEDKTINMKMAGFWKEDMRKNELSTDLLMAINMEVIPEEALEKLATTFNYMLINDETNNIDFMQRSFLESAAELLDEENKGERETEKLVRNVQDYMVYTDIKMAEQIPSTFLISGVNFNYDKRLRTMYCDSKVGLIGINGKSINKQVNAKIVYQFGTISSEGEKQPDKISIYLEVDAFNWVYLRFEEETVYTVSSYFDEYNIIVDEAINKRRSDEGFIVEMASEDEKNQFLQDFILKFIRN